MENKKLRYISSRYLSKQQSSNSRLINGYHMSEGKRIAVPFRLFFPEAKNIKKTTGY